MMFDRLLLCPDDPFQSIPIHFDIPEFSLQDSKKEKKNSNPKAWVALGGSGWWDVVGTCDTI